MLVPSLASVSQEQVQIHHDFGDNWRHTVTVEDRPPARMSHSTPVDCIAGQNACPPEDVGGVGGYAEFLEAISDPSHDEHAARGRWSGGPRPGRVRRQRDERRAAQAALEACPQARVRPLNFGPGHQLALTLANWMTATWGRIHLVVATH